MAEDSGGERPYQGNPWWGGGFRGAGVIGAGSRSAVAQGRCCSVWCAISKRKSKTYPFDTGSRIWNNPRCQTRGL